MGYQCLGEGAGSLPSVPTLYYYCRLYLNRARVGYQCLGEGAGTLPSLPPARLRLHTTRLALTTLVTPSCLAIQVRYFQNQRGCGFRVHFHGNRVKIVISSA